MKAGPIGVYYLGFLVPTRSKSPPVCCPRKLEEHWQTRKKKKMGQVQSEAATATVTGEQQQQYPAAVASSSSSSSSMGSRIAEAAAYGSDGNESLDAKALKALECPCIADLRSGPCGLQFSEAFLCYLKSRVEEKGSDCVHPFIVLQKCIKANPDAFSEDNVDSAGEVKQEEKLAQDYKIYPPTWSKQSQTRKSKL